MKMDTRIPDTLSRRVETLKALTSAYDLLEQLNNSEIPVETEKSFVQKRINEIEENLQESESEILSLIDQFKDDHIAWTVAHLRYMQGYEWSEIAKTVGRSTEAIKATIYRGFKATS